MQKFLKMCTGALRQVFRACFGRDEAEFEKALKLAPSSWHIISSPQILGDGTITIFPYENKLVKSAVLAIKRRNNAAIAEALSLVAADFLLEELSEREMMENFSNPLIVSIPLSRKNMNEKGFNHGDLLAEMLAKQIPTLQFLPRALRKTRHTEPQKNLPRGKRLANLKRSMEVSGKYLEKVRGRCVIVVDDVTTTGATLEEAKRALQKQGALKVLTLALAH